MTAVTQPRDAFMARAGRLFNVTASPGREPLPTSEFGPSPVEKRSRSLLYFCVRQADTKRRNRSLAGARIDCLEIKSGWQNPTEGIATRAGRADFVLSTVCET